jgi:hypothetical protein
MRLSISRAATALFARTTHRDWLALLAEEPGLEQTVKLLNPIPRKEGGIDRRRCAASVLSPSMLLIANGTLWRLRELSVKHHTLRSYLWSTETAWKVPWNREKAK